MVIGIRNGVFSKNSEYESFRPHGNDMGIVPTPIDDNVTDTIIYDSFKDFGAEIFSAATRMVRSIEHKFCGSIEEELRRKLKEETYEEQMRTESRSQEQTCENESTNKSKTSNPNKTKVSTLDHDVSIDTFVFESMTSFGDDLIDKIGDTLLCSDDAMIFDKAMISFSSCHKLEDSQSNFVYMENEGEIETSSIRLGGEMKDVHNCKSIVGSEKSDHTASIKEKNISILPYDALDGRSISSPNTDEPIDSNSNEKSSTSLSYQGLATSNFAIHSQIPHIPLKTKFHSQKTINTKYELRERVSEYVTWVRPRNGNTCKLKKTKKSIDFNNKTYKQKRLELWLKQNKTESTMDLYRLRANVFVS